MSRLRLLAGAVALGLALGLVLAGCGGPAADDDAPAPEPPGVANGDSGPSTGAPDGEPVPEALRRFRCERDGDGVWSASGRVRNPGSQTRDFQVTVHVGPADGATAPARTTRLVEVPAEKSTTFRLAGVEAASAQGPCHVQVLALS